MTAEMMQAIIQTLLTAVILPLLTYAGVALKKLIDEKIKDTTSARYLKSATDAVENAVSAVTQTYVSNLKYDNIFDEEAQKTAFAMALEKAKQSITIDGRTIIADLYGDFDTWLADKIEATVYKSKAE